MSGQTCFIGGLLLESASDSNSIMVLGTCGQSDAVIEGWPLGAVASQVTASGTSAHWTEVIHAEGGQYRMCWCSGTCNSVEKFSADLGSMSLIGPAPLQYARTCISGRQCAFDGLAGEGLSVGDAIQILNTCGTYSAAIGVPFAGRAVTVQTGTVNWGSLPISGPGGRYKLCWCSSNFKCGPEELRLEIGTLDVIGPRPLSQDRTCISGLTCFSPQLTGYHIGVDSQVVLLSSCGVGSHSVKEEITSAQWNRGIISAPGGQYRVCWCMPDQELDSNASSQNTTDCSRWAHFQTDVGTLKVIGPSPWDQRQTCISGQTCKLAIQGEGSLLTARVLILETCGVGAGFPGAYFMPGGFLDQNSSDLGMDNVEEIRLASGGTYRLCWCAGTTLNVQNITAGCLESAQFQTDFGSVDIVGPAPLEQDRTCVSGLPCEIQGITGLYLNQDRLPDISGIRIKQDGSLIFDITRAAVQVSYYTAVGPYVDIHSFELQTGISDWQEVFFNETNAPFFRFLVQESYSGWQPKPRELQWYSRETWVQNLPSTWLFGASGIPWKTASSNPYVHGPEKLVDGETELLFSRWETTGFPRWHDMWHVTFDFRDGDQFLILDTCGIANSAKRLPDAGMVQVVSQSGATVSWNTPLTAAGQEYKLCWCAAYHDCDTPDQFRTTIGALTLVGPHMTHTRTCVSGQVCKLEGLTGYYTSDRNMLAILDTCAQFHPLTENVLLDSLEIPFANLGSSGATVNFGTISAALGGSYRLCWCPMVEGLSNATVVVNGSDVNRTSLVDCFKVDMGELHLVGPVLGESRTCVSGRACFLDGFQGKWLLDTDRVLVMDTCGQQVASGFDSQGAALVQSIGTVQWAMQPITAAGGQYRICWCSLVNSSTAPTNRSGDLVPCEAAHVDAFLTDVGTLQVLGPNPFNQRWTCISGQSCKIGGIDGIGLSNSDSIMVLQTCATASVVPRFPLSGQAEILVGEGSEAAWVTAVSAPGGIYQLCWCSELDSNITGCAAPDHAVSFGSLAILGPSPMSQAATCISGQSCRVDGMTGLGWVGASDLIAVMETCGVASAIPRWGNEGIAETFLGIDSGASFSWQHLAISAAGGNYRLCWCGGFVANLSTPDVNGTVTAVNASWGNSSVCGKLQDFQVDFGRLTLLGPAFGDFDSFTCVAGQSCRIDALTGLGLSFSDNYLVLDTCSVSHVKNFVKNSTVLRLIQPVSDSEVAGETVDMSFLYTVEAIGGRYRLCWCPSYLGCNTAEDFRVDVAEMNVIGPNPYSQDRTCISGRTCVLDGITGWYLSERDVVMILETCGNTRSIRSMREPLAVSGSGSILQLARSIVPGSSFNGSWQLSSFTASAGEYRLCWCSGSLSSGSCDLPALEFGSLNVLAPTPGTYTCFSGLPCILDSAIEGEILLADTCGTPTLFFPSTSSTLSNASGTSRTELFVSGSLALGASYRLCWCGEVRCQMSEDFRVDLGALYLVGPQPQDQTCVLGLLCSIPVPRLFDFGFDQHLQSISALEPSVMVLETCGQVAGNALPSFQLNFSQVSTVDLAQYSVPAKLYRLCWCAPNQVLGHSCISEVDFTVDFGHLAVLGPNPLEQDRTCVSGHPCELADFHMSVLPTVSANYMILDSCGSKDSSKFQRFWPLSSSWMHWTSSAGIYRLCWCAQEVSANRTECLLSEQFTLEFGQLTVLGPTPLQQHITCVSGTSCSLADFQDNFADVTVGTTSWIFVLDTCATSAQMSAIASNVLSTEGVFATSAAGGNYRLCWCGGQFNTTWQACLGSDARLGMHLVDAGELTLIGPRLQQQWTCISGMTCTLNEIKGHLLSLSDHMMVMDTCGLRVAAHFPEEGSVFAVSGQCGCASQICTTAATDSNGTCDFCGDLCPSDALKQQPGQCGCGIPDSDLDGDGVATCLDGCPNDPYKSGPGICGCGVADIDTDGDSVPDCVDHCPGTADVVDVASNLCCLMVDSDSDGVLDCFDQCPNDLNKQRPGRCGCGVSDIDTDFDSVPDCVDLCPTDPQKSAPGTCGCGVSEHDADFDGVPDCVDLCPGSPDTNIHGISATFGQLPVTAASGVYRLCWCQDDCASLRNFDVDVGSLQILGIVDIQSKRTCVSGQSCYVQRLLDSSVPVGNRSFSQMLVLDTCGELPLRSPNMSLDTFHETVFVDPDIWIQLGRSSGWTGNGNGFPSAGGFYRLCWCSTSRCSLITDFHVDVGELMLIGPYPQQQMTCIAGQTCMLDGLQGLGLQDTDRIQVLDTCGVASNGLAANLNASLANAVGALASMTFPGGSYRLCWCASGFNCLLQEDFRVDFGEFSNVGPAPLAQGRTCVTGQVCHIEPVVGHMLTSSDSFWILDTCGIAEATPRLAGHGQASMQNNSILMTWGDTPHSASGGQYRLCWCSGSIQCEVSGNHQVDVGEFLLMGPTWQDRTCISGQLCFMKALPGFYLQPDDRMLVLDTCETASPILGFPVLKEVASMANATVVMPTSSVRGFVAGSFLDFVTASGGQYSLCWCAANFGCNLATDFRVHVGSLTLIGPGDANTVPSRICVLGRLCVLDNLMGQHLQSTDVVMLLDTCGQAALGAAAVALPSASSDGFSNTSVWTAAGGSYRLCWCAGIGRCINAEEFKVDAGHVQLMGPSTLDLPFLSDLGSCDSNISTRIGTSYEESLRTCWMKCDGDNVNTSMPSCVAAEFDILTGLCLRFSSCNFVPFWSNTLETYDLFAETETPLAIQSSHKSTYVLRPGRSRKSQDSWCFSGANCVVDVVGHLLTEGDGYAVLDTCGTSGGWRSTNVEGRGRLANPCGCMAAMNDTDGDGVIDCTDECPEDPNKIQVGLCGCGQSDIDSDSDGAPNCLDRCPYDSNKQSPGVCGCGISDVDSDLDGVPDCVDHCPGFADSGCLAANLDSDGDGVLDFADLCPLDGNKSIVGICGCGHSEADDDQDGIPNCVDFCPNNPHKVFPGACGCETPDLDMDGDGTPDCYDRCSSFDSVFHSVSIDFGLMASGQYRLCWCSRSLQKCVLDSEFNVDVGALNVIGPYSHQRTCISGQLCEFGDLVGVGLQNDDRLLLLDSCAANSQLLDGWMALGLRSSGSSFTAQGIISASGGRYRLCWCSTRSWNQNQVSCEVAGDFQVDMGELSVIGPSPLSQSHTCVSGQPCGLPDFQAFHVSTSDTIMILDTCGGFMDSSLISAVPGDFFAPAELLTSKVLNASEIPLTGSGGQYRLCWCSGGFGECFSTGHILDFGHLDLLGPKSASRTCVSGQSCEFSLQVLGASMGDRLLLLETCGQSTSLFGSRQSTRGHCGKTEIAGTVPLRDFLVVADLSADNVSHCRDLCENQVAANGVNMTCAAAMYKDVDLNVTVTDSFRASEYPVGHCRLYAICSLVSDDSSEYLVLVTPLPRRQNPSAPARPSSIDVNGSDFTSSIEGTAVFSWGSLFLTSPGSTYRMCWCADGFQCETSNDFLVDVGPLTLIGPSFFETSRTCTSGLSCMVTEIQGVGLLSQDQILLQDTCGADFSGPFSYLTNGNNSGFGNLTLGPDGTFVVFNDGNPLVAQSGQYRLCWCAAGFACVLQPYNTDMGELMLLGPSPLQQQRTCVTGRHCEIEALTGLGIDSADLVIMDTCGHSATPLFPNEGVLVPSNGGSWTSNTPISAAGGIYRLCWCQPHSPGCLGSNFVDSGSLHVLGPTSLSVIQTCVSGRHCSIRSHDSDLAMLSGSFLQVLDTCGFASLIPGFEASLATGVSGLFSWGPISAAAGSFRLCWCGSLGTSFDCDASDHFRVDLGELFVLGPPSVMERTCVSGLTCSWSIPVQPPLYTDITGQIDVTDAYDIHSLMILETCGKAHGVEGLPFTAALPGQADQNGTNATVNPVFHWAELTAPGGTYRLCWCGKVPGYGCSSLEAFQVDVGELTLLGPTHSQERTCVSGYSCLLYGLEGSISSLDHLAVFDTCGIAADKGRFDQSNASDSWVLQSDVLGDPILTEGGRYRLCWCSSFSICSTASDFNVNIGSLTLIGPSPLSQSFTCISGVLCETSFLWGQDLSSNDSIAVLDNCALGTYSAGLPSASGNVKTTMVSALTLSVQFDIPITAAAGTYRLCWCQPLNRDISDACDFAAEHRVDFGQLTLLGPALGQQRTCIAGQQCTLEGLSLGESWSSHNVLVLDTCSVKSPVQGWPSAVSASSGASLSFGSVTAAGGLYQLCWCGQDCENLITIGAISLIGPSPIWQRRTCYSGQLCDLRNFEGFGLEGEADGDSLALLDTCGLPGEVSSAATNSSFSSYGRSLSVITSAGGTYRLCWCSQGFDCSLPQNYVLDFGDITILGPNPILTQSRTCVLGQACRIEHIDVHGEETGSLHVLETCGMTSNWLGSFDSNSTGQRQLSEFQGQLRAGEFRLCWCNNCEEPQEMNVDVGRFVAVGVSPSQDRTCVSGQTCFLDGISGYHLQAVDQFIIAATCGEPKSILPVSLAVVLGGASVSVSTEVLMASGEFRLCWCSGQFSCVEASDFQVDVGILSIIGPSQQQSGTCVSGQLCALEQIKGTHLSPGDRLLILDTCGIETSPPRLPNAGLMDVLLSCQCAASNGDSDLDGVKNCLDQCPFDFNTSTAGLCGCGVEEVDSDADGTPDCLDVCPQDPGKSTSAGVCGCNVPEVDSDSDGVPDCLDLCPSDSNKFRPGICPGPEWLEMSSKVTHQSSTDSQRSSHLAVDSSTSANFYQGSCTLTSSESNPWWYVDLGHVYEVNMVRLTPRTDCCDTSILGMQIWTSSISCLATALWFLLMFFSNRFDVIVIFL